MAKKTKSDVLTTLIADERPPHRVLSMDGGGIYGAFTARMLRKLCERDDSFLTKDQICLFAGTSAGALNALFLAKHDNPRSALENGALENVYKDERLYSNKLNPITGALSLFMLTSWSGKADFYSILNDHFGDMRMKHLKHRVLITSFDFSGAPESVFGQPRWKPKIFYNFPGDEADRELYVKDVAYGAASPPTLRPVVNGITDGGFFASDPSMHAVAKIVSRTRKRARPKPEQLLKRISVLSLGIGAKVPNYFLSDFNFGALPFNLLPTNAMRDFFKSPVSSLMLNPATDTTTYEVKQMLGEHYYFRLNPPVIGFPVPTVIDAVYLARSRLWREFILDSIRKISDSKDVSDQIDKTEEWMKNDRWTLKKSKKDKKKKKKSGKK